MRPIRYDAKGAAASDMRHVGSSVTETISWAPVLRPDAPTGALEKPSLS